MELFVNLGDLKRQGKEFKSQRPRGHGG